MRTSRWCLVLLRQFKGKKSQAKLFIAKVRNSLRMNDPLENIWIIAEKCPSQICSGKIFWKLLTVKQQIDIKHLAMVHLV